MKVGIVTSHYYPTGQEIRVEKFAEAFAGAGLDVVVLCPGRYGETNTPPNGRVQIVPFRPKSPSFFSRLWTARLPINPVWSHWLTSQIRRHDLDAIIVRDLRLSSPTFAAAKRCGIPAILDIAEHYPGMMEIFGKEHWSHHIIRNQKLIIWLEQMAVRAADRVWVVVEENRQRLAHLNSRIDVISNYPLLQTAEVPQCRHTPYSADGPPVRLLFLGMIDNIRSLDLAIDAFAELLKELPNVELEIHGDGPFLPTLRAQAQTLKLERKVKFMSWTSGGDKYNIMSRSDVGLILHRMCALCQHTIPNKLFDYMAVQLPVISTMLRPIQSVLEREDCGVVVVDNPKAVAAELAKLILDRDARVRMGANGAQAVKVRYGWEAEANKAIGLIQAIKNDRARPTYPSGRAASPTPLETGAP